MSHISPAGSFGFNNWFQGVGSAGNSQAPSGANGAANGGSNATITEESFAIVDINFSGPALSAASPTSLSTNSSSDQNSTSATSTPDTSNSSTPSSGSDLFTNLLNQIQTALQDVLQAFEGNTTGAPTASGNTSPASAGTSGTAATGTGSTSSSDPAIATTPITTQPNTVSSNATGSTNPAGTDPNTPATSGETTNVIVAAISIESIDVTTGGQSPATTTGTDSSSTGNNGNTNSSNSDLQLLQQVFSSLSSVFQQNGLGSSQTSSAQQSPLAGFLGQNGLSPDQFTQGLFSSLRQNGGTGFDLSQIFQNVQSGQNLNLIA
jgi:hypothetical protein